MVSSQKVTVDAAEKQLELFVENQLQNTFRNFSLLSRFLSCPEMLRNQTVFSINQKNCAELINQYYEVDSAVFRELLANRFKQSKNRKKTLAEKCGKPPIVCKRVESNFERILKFALQLTEGNVVELIQMEFLFPLELAQKYERILFICYHKFDMSKKRIENLTYNKFDMMARSMLSWCTPDENIGFDRFQIEKNVISLNFFFQFLYWRLIIFQFSDQLKFIKNQLQTKEIIDEMKLCIFNSPDPQGCVPISPEKRSKLEKETPKLISTIVNIGVNLDQPREFKDFFVDIIEKVRNPLKERDLSKKEMSTFFSKLLLSFSAVIGSRDSLSANQKKKLFAAWQRYIICLNNCLCSIYRSA